MGIDLTTAARVVPLTALTSGASVSRSTYDKQTVCNRRARRRSCRSCGRAEYPWQGYTLSGNVSPSGYILLPPALAKCSRGPINSQYRITGQVTGYCTYDLTSKKALIRAVFRECDVAAVFPDRAALHRRRILGISRQGGKSRLTVRLNHLRAMAAPSCCAQFEDEGYRASPQWEASGAERWRTPIPKS